MWAGYACQITIPASPGFSDLPTALHLIRRSFFSMLAIFFHSSISIEFYSFSIEWCQFNFLFAHFSSQDLRLALTDYGRPRKLCLPSSWFWIYQSFFYKNLSFSNILRNYIFWFGMLIWVVKNLEFSHHASVVRGWPCEFNNGDIKSGLISESIFTLVPSLKEIYQTTVL